MSSRVHTLLLVALLLAASAAITAGATYDVDVQGSIDVPARTVTFKDSEYTIASISRADPGDDLSIQTTAPSDADYRVYLYNSDKQIVADPKASGSASLTIGLDGLKPGSYMLTMYDGEYRAVHPVVIRGYTVHADGPQDATRGDEINVSVDLSATASSGQPAGVEVVIADADEAIRTVATHQSGGHYTTTVALTGIDTGTYKLYAVAQGTERVFGHTELLGISTPRVLSVSQDTSGSGGGTGGGTETTTTPYGTTSPPPANTTERTTTPQPTPTTTTSGGTSTATLTPTETANENVITPAPSTASENSPTTPGQDQNPLLALLALVLSGVWYSRRFQ